MATINIPDDIMLPMPELSEYEYRIALSNSLKDYFIKLKQTLSEIESKLP